MADTPPPPLPPHQHRWRILRATDDGARYRFCIDCRRADRTDDDDTDQQHPPLGPNDPTPPHGIVRGPP